MSDDVEKLVRCRDCKQVLADPSQPCPNCGSVNQHVEVTIRETLTLHSSLGIKGRTPGEKRPFVELVTGASFSTQLKRWMHKDRLIHRRGDRYTETVTDPETGEVIHHVDEALSDHLGHGSAKRAKSS